MRLALPFALALIAPAPALAELSYGAVNLSALNNDGFQFNELITKTDYSFGNIVVSGTARARIADGGPSEFESYNISLGYVTEVFGARLTYGQGVSTAKTETFRGDLQVNVGGAEVFVNLQSSSGFDSLEMEFLGVNYAVNDALSVHVLRENSSSFERNSVWVDYASNGAWSAEAGFAVYTGSVERTDLFGTLDYAVTDDITLFGGLAHANASTADTTRYHIGAEYAFTPALSVAAFINGRQSTTGASTEGFGIQILYDFGSPAFAIDQLEMDQAERFNRMSYRF